VSETERDGTSSGDRTRAYAWAVLGGVIYFLGWAGFGYWPLALVSLVPVWAALELSTGRPWQAALGVSWVYGIVMIAGGYHWLVPFFEVFSGYGSFASVGFWLAFSVFIGAQYGVYGVVYWLLRRRGWSVALAAIPPFIAAEWLYPKLFPVYLANSFNQQPLLVQIADLGGPLLVTAVAAMVNLTVFETWRWWRGVHGAPRMVWLVTVLSLGFTLGYGPQGLWWGLVAGLFAVAAFLLIRVAFKLRGHIQRVEVD